MGKKRWFDEAKEIEELEERIEAGAPKSGTNPLAETLSEGGDGENEGFRPYVGAKLFEELPLSRRTRKGLDHAGYIRMTDIQRAALPHALCGRDILGAAKTGSGKTLAFIIPVIEKLYRLRWGASDGLGALIISPTRELAIQIFDELRKAGEHHTLSGGLLIGGRKDVVAEKDRVGSLNIIVCTPGRLLQHMDEAPSFDSSNLQVLVLDEADRILDMGFAATLNAIVAQIPKSRQTLLFSATQTRSVQDLARLSLQDPEYLAVHAESKVATPSRLKQMVMIVPLDQKLSMLWSFVKSHLRSKILVFLSSCKQVKFVHEAFKRLRPGIPLACLHGRMKQAQRIAVYYSFVEDKHSVLFATDIAARGLDFPTVDWVVQVDCPEDVASYIHRVGRTARNASAGRSLLFLAPSEEQMTNLLIESKVPLVKLKPNEKKIQDVSQAIAGLLSKDPDLKYKAQRAFVTYLRSIHLRGNKEIFDVTKLPVAEFAVSMGLATTPRVRFLKNVQGLNSVHGGKNISRKALLDAEGDGELAMNPKIGEGDEEEDEEEEEEFLQMKKKEKRKREEEEECEVRKDEEAKVVKRKKQKKLRIDGVNGGKRVVFDEEGNAIAPLRALAEGEDDDDAVKNETSVVEERYKKLAQELKRRDKEDREIEKQRLRENRTKMKNKLLKLQQQQDAAAAADDDDDDDDDDGGGDDGVDDDDDDDADDVDDDDGGGGGGDDDDDDDDDGGDVMTIAQQEAMALKLLNSRKR